MLAALIVVMLGTGCATREGADQSEEAGIPTIAADVGVSVLQKGYSIADRVLRPALVTVAGPK